jgi:hypothetical protein
MQSVQDAFFAGYSWNSSTHVAGCIQQKMRTQVPVKQIMVGVARRHMNYPHFVHVTHGQAATH